MLLRTLTLDNVGVYRGPQIVRFATSKEHPITLIGGKNGAGKTTLLESIPLALHGGRTNRVRNGPSYSERLNRLVCHGEHSASITLEFEMVEDGRRVKYVVERAWNRATRGNPSDRLQVSTNDKSRPDLVASWPEFAERIMPMAVADLAFFDGEKIESLADPSSSAEVLRTSLYGLLGLDLVDQLRTDLRTYRRRTAKSRESQSMADLTGPLGAAEESLAAALKEQESANRLLLDAEDTRAELATQLQEAKDSLVRAGGGLFAEREDIQRRLAEANACAGVAEGELFQLAAGDLPLAMVPELLKQVVSAGDQSESFRIAQHLRSAMSTRNVRLAERLILELELDEAASETVRAVLATDLDSVDRSDAPSFSPTPECASAAHELLTSRAKELQTDAKRLIQELHSHHSESVVLENVLAAVPDRDKVASIIQLVARAESDLSAADKEIERARLVVDAAERRAADAQGKVEALAHGVLNEAAAHERVARIAREISMADDVLAEFSGHIVRKHLGRITNEINASLVTLLHKQKLATAVSIDPEDLSISFLTEKGEHVDARGPSAGERQILATAVLWGLSRVTGMTLPTVIDTPLGRLDRSHRTNIIDRYFPNASRQVVLLSTDEEITGEYLKRLRPHVGQAYTLDFDETDESTSIFMGYFDE